MAAFLTGGKDGKIIYWYNDFKTYSFNITELNLKILSSKISAICETLNRALIIVTRGGDIIEYANTKSKQLMKSHYNGELRGLVAHPKF